jgi:molecular chaperone DnaJ
MPAGMGRFDAPFTRGRPLDYDIAGGSLRRSALRGLDVHHTVHLSLEDVARGVTRDIQVPRREVCILCGGTGAAPGGTSRGCPTCHGSGRGRSGAETCLTCGGCGSVVDLPCGGCGGSGRRQGLFDLEGVHFAAGLPSHGFVKRFKGEGDPGARGGPRGELLLHVVVDEHPWLRRATPDGADILSDVAVSPERAVAGGRIEVPTVYGPAGLRLPRGVVSGARFTLRGKGLRRHGRLGRGDQVVIVRIDPALAGHAL